jgi:hypothetical protein
MSINLINHQVIRSPSIAHQILAATGNSVSSCILMEIIRLQGISALCQYFCADSRADSALTCAAGCSSDAGVSGESGEASVSSEASGAYVQANIEQVKVLCIEPSSNYL